MFSDGLFEHADRQIQTKTLPSLAIPSALPIHRIMFRLTAYPISPKQATFIGLFAVCFWSSVIGLIRTLSLHMGPVGGAAVMYSLATILLLLIFGKPDLRRFSRNYLFWAGIFFVGCELCLSLSIGYADNARQTVEIGMVNYLWPTFTIIGAVWFNKQPAKWWIAIGFALSFIGIAIVLGGEGGLSPAHIYRNVLTNPAGYIMALLDALFWAAYCTLTARVKAQGNAVGFFFFLVSCVLWAKYFAGSYGSLNFDTESVLYALAAASCMGLGYAVWNIGISRGNMTVLAGASYFIPVFSALISSFLLDAPLPTEFWQGAAMVCIGSAVCWLATQKKA
ncbi:aromatic amino acid transporter [Neisseria sp. HMSC071C03]|nr:aromatic amino acid transporter [Neisseria sp. HMSC071B12]OHR50150.1 aromatic amino acid transporter [Neisseria sp. HMSC071C03]